MCKALIAIVALWHLAGFCGAHKCELALKKAFAGEASFDPGGPIVVSCTVSNNSSKGLYLQRNYLLGRHALFLANQKGEKMWADPFADLEGGIKHLRPKETFVTELDLSKLFSVDRKGYISRNSTLVTPGLYTFSLKFTDYFSPGTREKYKDQLITNMESNKIQFRINTPKPEFIAQLMASATDDGLDMAARVKAINCLGLMKVKDSVDLLNKLALKNPPDKISLQATHALKNMEDEKLLKIGLRMLRQESDQLKYQGAFIAEKYATKDDLPLLIEILNKRIPVKNSAVFRTSPYKGWYIHLARAIKKVGGPSARPVLEGLLKTEVLETKKQVIVFWLKQLDALEKSTQDDPKEPGFWRKRAMKKGVKPKTSGEKKWLEAWKAEQNKQ